MSSESRRVVDPNGRAVVFDAASRLHLAQGHRPWLLDQLEEVLATVERPDDRDEDPRPGRERFYRQTSFSRDGGCGWS
jgi:hypothetical protein